MEDYVFPGENGRQNESRNGGTGRSRAVHLYTEFIARRGRDDREASFGVEPSNPEMLQERLLKAIAKMQNQQKISWNMKYKLLLGDAVEELYDMPKDMQDRWRRSVWQGQRQGLE